VLRKIVGVVVGYAVFAVSALMLFSMAHQQPHETAPIGFMLLATLWGMAFAGLGGFLAAFIGGQRETSIAIAVIIAAGALISLISDSGQSSWSQIVALLFMAPMAVIGGRIIKAREPFIPGKKKLSGTHLVTIPPKGYSGSQLTLDSGQVDLRTAGEYRGYETPQADVIALKWEGKDGSLSLANTVVKRFDWVFEGVTFFDVGSSEPASPESGDRTLDHFEVLDTDPQTRVRLKFHGGVVIDVAATSTHVLISS